MSDKKSPGKSPFLCACENLKATIHFLILELDVPVASVKSLVDGILCDLAVEVLKRKGVINEKQK